MRYGNESKRLLQSGREEIGDDMTKREFLDIVFALAPNEANAIMDAFDEYVESNEPHWTPCSERLPKTNVPVNVTYVNHNPGNYYAEVKDKPYTATAHFHNGQWYWYSCATQDLLNEYGTWIPDRIDKDVEITAWCELPEPFKGVTT